MWIRTLPTLPGAIALIIGACDSEPTTPAEIPADPNLVEFLEGTVTVRFPETTPEELRNSISVEPTTLYPSSGRVVSNAVFEFGPAGTTFTDPVEITIKYDESNITFGITETRLRMYRVIEDEWQKIEGSEVGTSTDAVSGQVTTFSVIGVFAECGSRPVVFDTVPDESICYFATGLGAGNPSSVANDINDLGQVTGFHTNSVGWSRGFSWENGEFEDLGLLGEGGSSSGQDINNNGQTSRASGVVSSGDLVERIRYNMPRRRGASPVATCANSGRNSSRPPCHEKRL